MLSEKIKEMIQQKAGLRVRYVRDCNTLAEKISTECKCHISGSTIRRIWGFAKGTREPRTFTLDLLAGYLGYASWMELLLEITGTEPERVITEISAKKLRAGARYVLEYKPDKNIVIEYIGKSRFRVLSAKNSRLSEGDVFVASVITLHHPLFLLDVERNGNKEGRLLEARVSGVTSIRKL